MQTEMVKGQAWYSVSGSGPSDLQLIGLGLER
jgi:hypothetical protein